MTSRNPELNNAESSPFDEYESQAKSLLESLPTELTQQLYSFANASADAFYYSNPPIPTEQLPAETFNNGIDILLRNLSVLTLLFPHIQKMHELYMNISSYNKLEGIAFDEHPNLAKLHAIIISFREQAQTILGSTHEIFDAVLEDPSVFTGKDETE